MTIIYNGAATTVPTVLRALITTTTTTTHQNAAASTPHGSISVLIIFNSKTNGTLLMASPIGEMQLGLIQDQFRAAVSAVGRTRKPSRTLWRECSTNCRFSWMNQEWIVRNFILCIFSGEEYLVHSYFGALVLLLQYSTYCTNYVVCSHRKG